MYQQQQQQGGYQQGGYPPQQYPPQQGGYPMAQGQMPMQPVQYQPMNIQQPGQVAVPIQNQSPQVWKNSLFGCLSDIGSCILTCCFPCVQYGMNYEKVHQSGCCSQGCTWWCLNMCGCCCLVHKELRSDIRRKYNIREDCSDCLTTCLCGPCAICQEARELKERG